MKRKTDPATEAPADRPAEPPTEESSAPFLLEEPNDPPASAPEVPPSEPEPMASPPPPPGRGGFLAPLLGGALAAVGGFALSHFDLLELRPDTQVDLTALAAQQAEATATLRSEQATALEGLGARIDDLSNRLTEAEAARAATAASSLDPAQLDALDARLKAIEAIPAGGEASSAALAAALADLDRRVATLAAADAVPTDLAAKVDAALAGLAKAQADATARADEAAAISDAVRQRTALQDLRAVVESGAPFESSLVAVSDNELQAALAGQATTGTASLASLQDSFPEAARAALNLARAADTSASWGDRLVGFLAAQTGARSLTPREGSDPDAILSRAEAAVREGRLADALAEIGSLDPAVAAPLSDWATAARQRVATEAALDAASARLLRMEE